MTALKRVFIWGLVVCGSVWLNCAHAETNLLTDLESSQVKITVGFTGQHVLVFGNMKHAGDVVIRVTSPYDMAALSRKARVGPFWINQSKLLIEHVPGLAYLISNRPLSKITDRATLKRYGLSFHSILASAKTKDTPPAMYVNWPTALARLKLNQGMFRAVSKGVRISNGHLFSANFSLPAALPVGVYKLDIFTFYHGQLVGRQSNTLNVNEIGFERWISQTALEYSWIFGVLFTLLAIVLGLTLSILLRRSGKGGSS